MTGPDPGPVVVIGLKEIYEAVLTLKGEVARMADQQQNTVQNLARMESELKTDLNDHESRIRSLEKGRWPIQSVTILISLAAVVVAVLTYLTK